MMASQSTVGLAALALAYALAPTAALAAPALDTQIESLQEIQISYVKGGKGWKGGRAWGRSHNRGRHLGWYKQRRWR